LRNGQVAVVARDGIACELRSTRHDIVMKGFGGDGETIDTLDQVGAAVNCAFSSGVPYVLSMHFAASRGGSLQVVDLIQKIFFNLLTFSHYALGRALPCAPRAIWAEFDGTAWR